MPRRREVPKREVLPDPKFGSQLLTKFMNAVMQDGKKSVAEKIIYGALVEIAGKKGGDGLDVLEGALDNVRPAVEVKSRRVGGANFQVPTEVRPERKIALGMKWLINYSRKRGEKTMKEKLAAEMVSAAKGEGAAVKKKEDTHKMAEANKAFSHFRF